MSTVVLDTITGKSTATTITIGSTPVVSASANSMTIRGEGTAQTSIQQGLAKAWVNYNGIGTPSVRDSFNHSSITDNADADHTITHTNAFSTATNYLAIGTGGYTANGVAGGHIGFDRIGSNGNEVEPTSTARRVTHQLTTGLDEQKYASLMFMGDLA
jgi:hypothetical protein